MPMGNQSIYEYIHIQLLCSHEREHFTSGGPSSQGGHLAAEWGWNATSTKYSGTDELSTGVFRQLSLTWMLATEVARAVPAPGLKRSSLFSQVTTLITATTTAIVTINHLSLPVFKPYQTIPSSSFSFEPRPHPTRPPLCIQLSSPAILTMPGLVTATGVLGFLSDEEPELKVFALQTLNDDIDTVWTEVAGALSQMCVKPPHMVVY